MTYRGSLPTGQPGFPGQEQQQEHQQMYGGVLGYQAQGQFQQQQRAPHQNHQGLYMSGVADQFYGQQQQQQHGQFAQPQQNQYAARQQDFMRMQQQQQRHHHQQQQQQQQQPMQYMSGGGYQGFDGGGQVQQQQHQQMHVPQQGMWPQPSSQAIPQPQQLYHGQQPSPRQSNMMSPQQAQHAQRMLNMQHQPQQGDHLLQRMYQQQHQQQMQQPQAVQQHIRSPSIHNQPSPSPQSQPRPSPLMPSQMHRKHSRQGHPPQQVMQSPIQQNMQQLQSPPPPQLTPRLQSVTYSQPQPSQPSPRQHAQQHQQQQQQQQQQQHQHRPTPPPSQTPQGPMQGIQEPPAIAQPNLEPQSEPQPEPETGPEPKPQSPVPEAPAPPPIQEPVDFVNPLDIFNAPPPPPLPPMTMSDFMIKKDSEPSLANPVDSISMADIEKPPAIVKPSALPEPITAKPAALKHEPKNETVRIKSSPHSSVTNSPALSTRSPSITKRSPAPKPRAINTSPIMVAIAEECLQAARNSVHDVAMSLDAGQVDEYQRLVATSLSCLEAAMQNSKLAPREEARLRMRYAALLQEETQNLMEAEMALGKGITLCDKHRLIDLKYCMQYLMLKVLFQRSHKAALKAVDGHISDCEAFKHVQWYYAFRLLKSTFYMSMGNASDAASLENIRAVQNVANTRGDNAMSVYASILEGLVLLKTAKDSNIERVNSCIAQAAKFQFDPTCKILQLDVMMLLLDFASSLHHQNPDTTAQKLRLLQQRLDDGEGWNNVKSDFQVPVKKQPSSARTVSEETSGIICPGSDSDSEFDYVVISFMTKIELGSLVFMFSGLANMHKPSSRSTEYWQEGVKILDTWDSTTAGVPYGPSVSLSTAVKQRTWRTEAQAYFSILLGLLAASHCQWNKVKQFMARLDTLITPSTQPTIALLSTYLTGVHQQGTGNFQAALQTFLDPRFEIPHSSSSGVKAGQTEIALLAGLNRLWIMQHPSCRNDYHTNELLEQLMPLCLNHWNIDLRSAWHNVLAALETDPPTQLNQRKHHLHAAMSGSKVTNNILGAAVTLCIMRSRLFDKVVGDQALKSARAASKQAHRSGNMLWQSVADGMLAESYEGEEQREESSQERERATKEARDAFAGSW